MVLDALTIIAFIVFIIVKLYPVIPQINKGVKQ